MNLMDLTKFAAAWNQIDPGDTRTDDAREIREAFEEDEEAVEERRIREGEEDNG